MPPSVARKTWETCLTQISDQIPKQSFRTWFAPITPLDFERHDESATLRLAVPDAFHTEWLESHYAHVIQKVATDVVGQNTCITYEVVPREADELPAAAPFHDHLRGTHPTEAYPTAPRPAYSPERSAGDGAPAGDGGSPFGRAPHSSPSGGISTATPFTGAPTAIPSRGRPMPAPPQSYWIHESRLKPEYTFESFIEGDCNRLARSAAYAIAENPGGTSFNPFMVYGGVGLGKTHIVQAIGNRVTQSGKLDRVLYVSSEQFTSQFVRSIQENRISDFSSFYRQIDLIIVDDVQFFGGKEKTQEEFFHVFNELHQTGKQIILCADRPPSEISGIEERLLSRFRWGLSADIQPPDLETRIAILQHKAAQHAVALHPLVAEFVAERIRANIRQLEGALLKLAAHAELYGRQIDLELAKEILRDMVDDYQVRLEIEDIQRIVAQFYEISPELLSAKTRKREIVTARHVAMYFCKMMTSHSLKSIGLRFGGRDHSTVIHACNTIGDRIELEPAFRDEVEEVEQLLDRRRPSARRTMASA